MDNQHPTPNEPVRERERDENDGDTLRYVFSKGYMPMENPKSTDGELTTEIK